jgi:hypothetical protein
MLCVYYGTKPIEFDKGKATIAVRPEERKPRAFNST